MERVIKFRAWEKREKEMIYIDDLYWFEENGVHSIDEASTTTGDYLLMQYTGIKDKNGKDVYEGDIYKGFDSEVRVINYTRSIDGDGHPYAGFLLFGDYDTDDIEVIGNIYENPELKPN